MNEACCKSLERLRESAHAIQAENEENLVHAESRLKAKNDGVVQDIKKLAQNAVEEFRMDTLKRTC